MSDKMNANPSNEGQQFLNEWTANAAHLQEHGLYDAANEHDACGVGLIASLDGKPRRDVVEAGIAALKAVWHRGAVDADGKTGDGAGIHLQIPQDFFKEHIARTGHEPKPGRLAIGMVFLPRNDFGAQERCRCIVETEILRFGYSIYGWRQVPVNTAVIGEKANATRPEIEQIMVASKPGTGAEQFELDLYIIRRRIERAALAEHINDFYICSFSGRSIIYKGLFLAEVIDEFYPDLLDPRFVSNFAIFHQRYSTNTFPNWRLAQPFRMLAHNGEINTLRGNVNWMKSHEPRMVAGAFGEYGDDLKPVVQAGGSDSAALDNVFEVMVRGGRSAPLAKSMLIPDSWSHKTEMPQSHKDFFSYCNCVMEPWDGPAAIAATDGRWVVAGMDRNGLRPLRYTFTSDGLLIVGSESGMVPVSEANIIEKGRVGPGEMIGLDLAEAKFYSDVELKDIMASRHPYGEWVNNITPLDSLIKSHGDTKPEFTREELRARQLAAGLSMEDLELILHPMAEDGKEAVGSMGDDTPLAVLSKRYRGLHHYFRQNFSQVTNPPIDSLREQYQMSLKTRLGNLGNILDEDANQTKLLQLESPILGNAEFAAMRAYMGRDVVEIDCTFPVDGPVETRDNALRDSIARVQREAEDAIRGGCVHVILSDKGLNESRVAIPMILAAGGVHTHLVRQQLRTFTSLNVRSGECLDVHYAAVLIGVGATTVNAYLAEEGISDRHRRGLFPGLTLEECVKHYKKAMDQGLMKIMSKMGISVLSSYRGGYNFEALGLSRSLVADFFPGMTSRISGLGMSGIQRKALETHSRAYTDDQTALPVGGFYVFRKSGESHALEGPAIHTLQQAVATDSYATYKKFSEAVRNPDRPIALRDLLDFKQGLKAAPLDSVQSITEIRKRLVAPGISLGALGPEAHETLSIAMNRIGAKSDSGEGGEDPARYKLKPNGDNASSAIKQVASGRFGVTAEYLTNCRELEIKVAQGAKPGEGGQLPGLKVSSMIAKLRHATPGITLISPPPHHDIYSIEDLAQLIYDLKQINPEAKVCVKLVAQTGIGTIAAGVAKAKADVILVAGHSGGTGASPQSSIKHAGLPWEMGLSEVNQVLTLNRLRHTVKLRVDGGFKTGRDVVVAAMLGAEEFGLGTVSLVAMGCIMVRQCHSNTCPVGVCTQDEALRAKFTGTPEKVVNLFSFVAEEVREILASLGAHSIEDIIGRTDLLTQISRGSAHLDDLDLNPILAQADPGDYPRFYAMGENERNEVPETLDAQMIVDAKPALEGGEKMQLAYNVRNTQRAIGTKLSSKITRRFGMTGLAPGQVTVRLRGTAGQSLGAFAVQGLKIEVFGDANDYVGKGLSGGIIVVRPLSSSSLVSNRNTIIGNTVLYGATAGRLFAAGQAGERFAVRNSGAETVVEGCGSNGCEYMTGGTAVILGAVGHNFGAGMTGGMAYVYDEDETFMQRVNQETLTITRVASNKWAGKLRALVEEHVQSTQSRFAERLLNDWDRQLDKFWHVVPNELAALIAREEAERAPQRA